MPLYTVLYPYLDPILGYGGKALDGLRSGSDSGSCYFRQWSWRWQLNFYCSFCFFAYYFLKLHLYYFSKIKSPEPGGPKTYGSNGPGSATLIPTIKQTIQLLKAMLLTSKKDCLFDFKSWSVICSVLYPYLDPILGYGGEALDGLVVVGPGGVVLTQRDQTDCHRCQRTTVHGEEI